MMTLRTRLLLGYGYFVLLLLIASATGVVSLYALNGTIHRLENDSSRVLERAQTFYYQLDREQSIILESVAEGTMPDEDVGKSDEKLSRFLNQLEAQQVTGKASKSPSQLLALFEQYRSERNKLLEAPVKSTLSQYQRRVQPRLKTLKKGLRSMTGDGRAKIESIGKAAANTATRAAVSLGILVVVGLVSVFFMARYIRREIVDPLSEIRSVTQAVENGDDKRRIQLRQNDEFEDVADRYNRVLDQKNELQQKMQGRLNQQRQLLEGLLELESENHAVFSLDGRMVATAWTMTEGRRKGIEDWIAGEGRKKLRDSRQTGNNPDAVVEVDDIYMKLELLVADQTRPVGWYVRQLHR